MARAARKPKTSTARSGRMPTRAEQAQAAEEDAARDESDSGAPELREDERGPAVTASVLARHLDMTTHRVTQLANQGVLSRGADYTFEQGAARIAYIRWVRRQAQTRAATGDRTTPLIETKTLKAKLDLAIAQGEYVRIDDVEAALVEAFASMRNELAGLGASVTRDLQLRATIDEKVNDGIARVRSSLEAAATAAFGDSENDVADEEAAP